MKDTGMVRCLDNLGRICLPKELRNSRDIKEGDPVEIYVDGDVICLRKYDPDTADLTSLIANASLDQREKILYILGV